jgi:hypothetical protein
MYQKYCPDYRAAHIAAHSAHPDHPYVCHMQEVEPRQSQVGPGGQQGER